VFWRFSKIVVIFFFAAKSKRWPGREVASGSEMVAGERDYRKGER
jgi:hypothetical protein